MVRISLALLAIAVLAVACSKDEEQPIASPSSVFPSETGSTTGASGGTGASGTTGALPTTSPGSATGLVHGGTVRLHATGDIEIERTLDQMVSTVYEPPPGGALVLVWTAGGSNATTFGIGGSSFTGTMPTSSALVLSLVIQTSAGVGAFQSRNGECSITIDVATEDELAGGFVCSDLAGSSGEVVNASGSFQAEAIGRWHARPRLGASGRFSSRSWPGSWRGSSGRSWPTVSGSRWAPTRRCTCGGRGSPARKGCPRSAIVPARPRSRS